MARVVITDTAERDLEAAVRYIAESLANPAAASSLLNEYDDLLGKLETIPSAFPFVRDPVGAACGYRWAEFGNYMAFFIFDEPRQSVVIHRILYKRRDWSNLI